MRFRLKVDLSRVFKDARQYSWILIDTSEMSRVNDLINHIVKLFKLKTSFHLLSTDKEQLIFLPPNEDIHIIENGDTLVVSPGNGIDCQNLSHEEEKEITATPNSYNGKVSSRHEDTISNESQMLDICDNSISAIDVVMSESTTPNVTMYHSVLNETFDQTDDSKIAEDILTEDSSILEPSSLSAKRKRTRRKKNKKHDTSSEAQETEYKRPRIINSLVLPSGKHIRFDLSDKSEEKTLNNVEDKQTVNQFISGQSKAAIKSLGTLLGLRQSSTPVTFSHKVKKFDEGKMQEKEDSFFNQVVTEKPKMEDSINGNVDKNVSEKIAENTDSNEAVKKETIPVNEDLNETYSFKVLKISDNYTPQVSEVIVGRSLARNKNDSTRTFKILVGKEQLQTPTGKFSMPKDKDESEEDNDIVILQENQLVDLKKVQTLF